MNTAMSTLAALAGFLLLNLFQPAQAMSHGPALGTTAALDVQGRLWIVRTEPVDKNAHVFVQRSDDHGGTWQPALRVTAKPEPVSADGENRPKLAFGSRGALRFAIDPAWMGEKPRACRYNASGSRTSISGVLSVNELHSAHP